MVVNRALPRRRRHALRLAALGELGQRDGRVELLAAPPLPARARGGRGRPSRPGLLARRRRLDAGFVPLRAEKMLVAERSPCAGRRPARPASAFPSPPQQPRRRHRRDADAAAQNLRAARAGVSGQSFARGTKRRTMFVGLAHLVLVRALDELDAHLLEPLIGGRRRSARTWRRSGTASASVAESHRHRVGLERESPASELSP